MKIEITRRDIINMIRGSYPYDPEDRNIAFINKLAESYGGVCDSFSWAETTNDVWDRFDTEWLYQYYQRLEEHDIPKSIDTSCLNFSSAHKEQHEVMTEYLPYMLYMLEEEQKQTKELHEAMSESAHRAYVADNERWEQERPKVEAEAARNARLLFARNMKKLKARLHDAADGDIKPDK